MVSGAGQPQDGAAADQDNGHDHKPRRPSTKIRVGSPQVSFPGNGNMYTSGTLSAEDEELLIRLDQASTVSSWIDQELEDNLSKKDTGLLQQRSDSGHRQDQLEARANALLSRVDHLSTDLSHAADRMIEAMTHSAPKLAYDLQLLRDRAQEVEQVLLDAFPGTSTANAADEMHDLLKLLVDLDLAQKRMEEAKGILKQAENWSLLEPDIRAAIQMERWSQAATRLLEARTSLTVFEEGLEQDERKVLLASLEAMLLEQLEGLMRQALLTRDKLKGKDLTLVFEKLSEERRVLDLHSLELSRSFPTLWNETPVLEDQRISGSQEKATLSMRVFCTRYLDAMLTTLNAEQPYVASIYSDASKALDIILCTLLDSQKPSLAVRLQNVALYHSDFALIELVPIWTTFRHAVPRVQRTFTKLQPIDPSTSKEISSRQTASWIERLITPFVPHREEYQVLEERLIKALLNRDTFQWSLDDITLYARRIWEDGVVCFGLLEDAIERCQGFTDGWAMLKMAPIADAILGHFIAKIQATLQPFSSRLLNQIVRSNASRSGGLSISDIDGLTFADETRWDTLHSAVKLLETIYGILARSKSFQTHLLRTITAQSGSLQGDQEVTDEDRDVRRVLLTSTKLSEDHDKMKYLDTIGEDLCRLEAARNLSDMAIEIQDITHAACLRAIMAHVKSFAAASIWTGTLDDERRRQHGSALDTSSMPIFTSSPGPEITRLGEMLLGLPGHLESYCAYECMGAALARLPHLPKDTIDHLASAFDSFGHARKRTLSRVANFPQEDVGQDSNKGLSDRPSKDDAHKVNAEAIMLTWVTSLALSATHSFVHDHVLKIEHLSGIGIKQLETDVSYLVNVLQAMDIDILSMPDNDLSKVLKVCEVLQSETLAQSAIDDPIGVAIRQKLTPAATQRAHVNV